MVKQAIRVLANIEVDVDKIINEIMYKSGCDVSDISMDDIIHYISDNITYLSGNAPGIYKAEDGPSIKGFGDDWSYDRVEELLKKREREESVYCR